MKPKAELMQKLRKERAAAGLVELRLWLTPEQKGRVLKYVARFKSKGMRCDKRQRKLD